MTDTATRSRCGNLKAAECERCGGGITLCCGSLCYSCRERELEGQEGPKRHAARVISLRTPGGWAEAPNRDRANCDRCGSGLSAAPHGGIYCDSMHWAYPAQVEPAA